jgi:hypothetical protein
MRYWMNFCSCWRSICSSVSVKINRESVSGTLASPVLPCASCRDQPPSLPQKSQKKGTVLKNSAAETGEWRSLISWVRPLAHWPGLKTQGCHLKLS